jgi:hypothetical protein
MAEDPRTLEELMMMPDADGAPSKASSKAGPWAKIKRLGAYRSVATDPEPERWLLWNPAVDRVPRSGLLRRGKVGLLSARGGTGKTTALVGLAVAVVLCRRWLGFEVDAAGPVALLCGEEDAEEVHRKARRLVGMLGLSAADLRAVDDGLFIGPLTGHDVSLVSAPADGGPDADADPMAPALALRDRLAELRPDGWALVILDPLSRFAGAEAETDNKQATRTIEALELLTALPGGPAVLAAHHERKGGADGRADDDADNADAVRGASALVDGARWVARLYPCRAKRGGERWRAPAGPGVWFRVVKSNYAALPKKRLLVQDIAHAGTLRAATEDEHEKYEADKNALVKGEGSKPPPKRTPKARPEPAGGGSVGRPV